MKEFRASTTLPDGREISIDTGALAKQADGAVVLTCGETMLLATVVARKEINLEVDFLPLSVDYMEKFAAAGRFPGGFFKRDGRMGESEILTSRLIDRAIRPLFPDDYHGDTQVMVQMISSDSKEQPDALACVAASAALLVSDIPFHEPVSEVRVARKDGEFIVNPSFADMADCDLDLMVAATSDSINMVEGEMKEVSEETMLEALKVAHDTIRALNAMQEDLRAQAGKEKRTYDTLEFNEELYNEIHEIIKDTISEVAHGAMSKELRSEKISAVKEKAVEALKEKYAEDEYFGARFGKYFKKIQKKIVRDTVVKESLRLDGRGLEEVRPIWSRVGYLPRSHGSSVFTRGETQALCTVTLGTKFDEQTIDTATFKGSKRFMLQYVFPGFSTGEVKPNRGPARREVGHGNLAERALKVMIPDDTDYTLRVVSSILESNGSSSMASVCGGTLALMDAGIPMTRPVSGIAMGLITTEDGFAVLSDILGDEDFLGDMDFKVTGTSEGLTACQMDIKIRGLSYEILEKALAQSKAGRMHILEEMLKTLPEPRKDLSPYAPRFFSMEIPHESFGMVIGPGGKIIQEIQKTTNTTINLEEGEGNVGTATISADNAEAITAAVQQIRKLIQVPTVGDVYDAKVKTITDYGAFVEFLPGKEGLLHISEISYERLKSMEGIFKVGDAVKIKLIGVDPKSGKFRLSHKALLPKPEGYEEREDRDRGRSGGGGRRGPRNNAR
ncbi:polyribonucleotide nucleotidyltransferase [Pontibacter sp. G13]|uniref:polyribonucleotide nucleotidyltransferase n=1 Tax=Pontibacter sp. G13 TaxID=3074898 RepID=UPI00288903D6|nr:polyribonucleotide nucleotidyltransferase [Pontibacter sp. G13]WNJ16865.1 polyribonucleotide nucleotidyltransferase [Pontibacter sp. G13]